MSRLSSEQTGSVLLAIELLARALAFGDDDGSSLRLARTQLQVALGEPVSEPTPSADACPGVGYHWNADGTVAYRHETGAECPVHPERPDVS